MSDLAVTAHGTELTVGASGPRIAGFRRQGGPQLFAQLSDTVVIEHAEGPPYVFRGGHRLWVAPEIPAITYAPDGHAVEMTTGTGTVTLTAPADIAGITKVITATVTGPGRARVDHTVTNAAPDAVTVAPWAITQLRTGGTALLPLGTGSAPQAGHNLVLWPYTRLDDPLLAVSPDLVTVTAERDDPTKIGTTLTRGWMAYVLDGAVLVKRVGPSGPGPFVDFGATGQVFCNDTFVELETLGPLVTLAPGKSTHHSETWELHDAPPGVTPAEMIPALHLDTPGEDP